MDFRKWTGLLLLVGLLCVSLAGLADAGTLPIDFSGGSPALAEGKISDTEYQDDSIHVTLDSGFHEGTEYWTAHITIADPSQLRTVAASGFDATRVARGEVLARRVNAILAINGDYFCFEPDGYLIRQGQLYRNLPTKRLVDVLLIDDQGDFHIATAATAESLAAYADKNIINSFNFGPGLVIDGKQVTEFVDQGNAVGLKRQRMCLAQVGPLEYLCIATAGPVRGSEGMDIAQFAAFVGSFDVQQAYNLDGGDSTMMIFHGEKINDIDNSTLREISDIVYFASAVFE